MIEVELPDGTIAEFPDGTSQDVMRAALKKRFGGGEKPGAVALAAQAGAGSQEGIAGVLGLPVDAMTGAINGIGRSTGLWGEIESPVGGSETFERLLAPFREGVPEPQTGAQRIARRVGQEIGASSVTGPAAFIATGARAAPAAYAAVDGASALGSGLGAGIANEIAPDSAVAEIAGALVGGAAGGLAGARAVRPTSPSAPRIDELREQAKALYETARRRPGADPSGVADLKSRVDTALQSNSRITPRGRLLASGGIKSYYDVLEDYAGRGMTPGDMQSVRTILQDAASSADAGERRMASVLLRDFDGWAENAVPEFKRANALYARAKRAEDVDFRIAKADRRAASTGSGGNAVNAARQNIRQILDNPQARRGYSPDEITAMEAIVRGDTATNTLRNIGKLSPTSGALPLIASLAGVGISPTVAVPVMAASQLAKGASEVMTDRKIKGLMDLITAGSKGSSNATGAAPAAAASALLRILSGDALPQN